MSKEVDLTNRGQNPYPESGDKFMPDGLANAEIPSNVVKPQIPQIVPSASEKAVSSAPKPELTPERADQLRKAWEGHFKKSYDKLTHEEREVVGYMLEKGIAPITGGADVIVATDYTDLRVVGIIKTYLDELEDAGGPGHELEPRFYQTLQNRLSAIMDNEGTTPEVREEARNALREIARNYRRDNPPPAGSEGSYFYINDDDKKILDSDGGVEAWVNSKMSILYASLQGGDASQSKILERMQSSFQDAIGYKQLDSEEVRKLEEIFQTKMGLVVMNSAFAIGNGESVIGAARNLTGHRLLNGFNLDKGKVGEMFSRVEDLVEQRRLMALRGHVNPDMLRRAQRDIIKEQLELAERGAGAFADFYNTDANTALTQAQTSEKSLFRKFYTRLGGRLDGDKNLLTKREITRVEIESKVSAAFDLFVSTQRVGVHMARGDALKGSEAYRSEAFSYFTVYNLENLFWKKFNTWTAEDQKFLRRIKLDMANDYFSKKEGYNPKKISDFKKEEVGTRIFRDQFKMADIFSSSWRVDVIKEQLGDLYLYKKALSLMPEGGYVLDSFDEFQQADLAALKTSGISHEKALSQVLNSQQVDILRQKLTPEEIKSAKAKAEDMALFMRLLGKPEGNIDGYLKRIKSGEWKSEEEIKGEGSGEKEKDEDEKHAKDVFRKRRTWEKISVYRPEEIIRLFRERSPELLPEALRPDLNLEFSKRGIIGYDQFKEKFGGIVNDLRNKSLQRGEQFDVEAFVNGTTDLAMQQLAEVNKAFGTEDTGASGGELQAWYRNMREFINNEKIEDKFIGEKRSVAEALLHDDRFFDIYQRSLVVDDALLGELEQVPQNSGLMRLSEKIGVSSSGDMLVRILNDTNQAKEAGNALLKFLTTEDLEERSKAAIEFAQNTTYNGNENRARAIRFTLGSLYNLAKKPLLWDAIGLKKFPFRLAMTEYERTYGPGVDPMSRDEIRNHVDHISNLLIKDAGNPDLEEEAKQIAGWKATALLKGTELSEEEIEKRITEGREHKYHEAEEIKHSLEELVEIMGKDAVKRRGLQLLLFFLSFMLVEYGRTIKASAKDL